MTKLDEYRCDACAKRTDNMARDGWVTVEKHIMEPIGAVPASMPLVGSTETICSEARQPRTKGWHACSEACARALLPEPSTPPVSGADGVTFMIARHRVASAEEVLQLVSEMFSYSDTVRVLVEFDGWDADGAEQWVVACHTGYKSKWAPA